jgi:hypothetical protein
MQFLFGRADNADEVDANEMNVRPENQYSRYARTLNVPHTLLLPSSEISLKAFGFLPPRLGTRISTG